MKTRIISLLLILLPAFAGISANAAEYKREIYVNQNGTGDFTTITEALEAVRAWKREEPEKASGAGRRSDRKDTFKADGRTQKQGQE